MSTTYPYNYHAEFFSIIYNIILSNQTKKSCIFVCIVKRYTENLYLSHNNYRKYFFITKILPSSLTYMWKKKTIYIKTISVKNHTEYQCSIFFFVNWIYPSTTRIAFQYVKIKFKKKTLGNSKASQWKTHFSAAQWLATLATCMYIVHTYVHVPCLFVFVHNCACTYVTRMSGGSKPGNRKWRSHSEICSVLSR